MPAGETRSRSGAIGAAVVMTVVCAEYAARHLAAFWFPTITEPGVNDMIATGVAYVALSLGIARVLGAGDVGGAVVGLLRAGVSWLPAASLLLVNGLVVPVAEEWLWRGVVQPRLVRVLGAWRGSGSPRFSSR